VQTNVTFRYPAEFVGVDDDGGGVLAVRGAQWFVRLLSRVNGLSLDLDLCQEDWGVVVFAKRNGRRFWIGLSPYDEGNWVAHFHHGSFAWLQRASASGKAELHRLIADFHAVLAADQAISEITWYTEREMLKPNPLGFKSPNGQSHR
jgi:hypothetical protein